MRLQQTKRYSLCIGNNLRKLVHQPTRGEATLDKLISNIFDHYDCLVVCSPIGHSDHVQYHGSPCISTISLILSAVWD